MGRVTQSDISLVRFENMLLRRGKRNGKRKSQLVRQMKRQWNRQERRAARVEAESRFLEMLEDREFDFFEIENTLYEWYEDYSEKWLDSEERYYDDLYFEEWSEDDHYGRFHDEDCSQCFYEDDEYYDLLEDQEEDFAVEELLERELLEHENDEGWTNSPTPEQLLGKP